MDAYYEYLKATWAECMEAACNNTELAHWFFEKSASPYYYWLQNQAMDQHQQSNAGQPSEPWLRVILSDGSWKTIDHREDIKHAGFRWDTTSKSWTRTMIASEWNNMAMKPPFCYLTADLSAADNS